MAIKVHSIETKTTTAGVKSAISNFPIDSSPAFGTKKGLKSDHFEAFFDDVEQVWQLPVAVENYPFKLARLVHHRYNMKKRWYVVFYAWNVATEQLTRYRMFEPLNRIKNKMQRLERAEQIIRVINGQLRDGKVLGKDQLKEATTINPAKLTLLQSIEWVETQKKLNGHRENYYRSFRTLHTNLESWLEFKKHPDFPLKEFNEQDAREFFAYLRDEKKLANKSLNNFRTNLATAFNFIATQSDVDVWRKDPLRKIGSLPVTVKKHPAYSDAQIELIKKEIKNATATAPRHRQPGYRQLELFISFIYYLMARPIELLQLRVGDINLIDNRVRFAADVSKNKIEDYVEIAPRLATIIVKSKITKHPHEYFVFGKDGNPGPQKLHDNFFWDKHKRVLERTGLLNVNKHFSLYSYKHSGAVSLYKATKDIKLVQRQCRHHTLEQTNTYLRDLGVLSDYDQLKNYKGAV